MFPGFYLVKKRGLFYALSLLNFLIDARGTIRLETVSTFGIEMQSLKYGLSVYKKIQKNIFQMVATTFVLKKSIYQKKRPKVT